MKKVFLISSAGGHFNELKMLKLDPDKYQSIYFVEKTASNRDDKQIDYFLKSAKRSDFIKYLQMSISNSFIALFHILKQQPDVIISTGAHSCVPFYLIARFTSTKTIYIESFAKVTNKSLTYKIINRFCDQVIVQHEELKEVYPNSKFYGGIY